MVGVHFEMMYTQEDWSCDGALIFTVYGSSSEEARAWGNREAWDYIHQERPTRRALKTIKSAPVADYLLTEEGRVPLDFEEVRRLHKDLRCDDSQRFGQGASGRIASQKKNEAAGGSPPPRDLAQLRAWLEERHPPGSPHYDHIIRDCNWDPLQQAIYLFTVDGVNANEWSEAVFCRASNFHHAGLLWSFDGHDRGEKRPAGFSLANGLFAVGESPWASRTGRRR